MKVGFVGVGQMGGPMCSFAINAGHAVRVFDPFPAALDRQVAAGGRAATSPGDASRDVDLICVVVRDDDQAEDSIAGAGGVLDGARPGAILALHATVSLDTRRGHPDRRGPTCLPTTAAHGRAPRR